MAIGRMALRTALTGPTAVQSQDWFFGTESGAGKNQYDDSTSILTGTWGPVQTVQGTVFSQNQSSRCFQEVELRLQ
jgi:hypothetical protein